MKERMSLCRKIKLIPMGDKEEVNRVYNFIRDGQYAQYQGLNLLMGQIGSAFYSCNRDISSEEFKNANKEIFKNSNPLFNEIEFAKGVDSKSLISQKVKQDFSIALKNGLAKGERSINNYKRDYPLMTRSRDLKINHDYESIDELENHLFDADLNLTINWVNHISFAIILGNPYKSEGLRKELLEVFKGNYVIQGSSIQIKNKKDILLNLTLSIPTLKQELDENVVVGVDLGLAIPAVCALNNSDKKRLYIGNYEDFARIRTQLQAQRKRIQRNLRNTAGGHGRKKKLQALDRLCLKERHFVQTYNHMISKRVVDFALKNHAKYINMEDLSNFNGDKFVLRNWSYYELQSYITYKAEKVGIQVRKVEPAYTSQTCSVCGNKEEGQRIAQAKFHCKCCGYEENADFNGARNIALSTNFVEEKKKVSKKAS